MSQVRSISWTLHLFGIDEVAKDLKREWLERQFREVFPTTYWCYGEEKGSSGLTPHWQGFAAFTKRVSFKKLGSTLGFHIERAKGTAGQNKAYCSKEGGPFFEHGTMKSDKVKFGYAEAIVAAREGRLEDIELEAPQLFLRYRAALERVHLEHFRPLCRIRKCFWLVGKPRAGKSIFGHRFSLNGYIKSPNKWWGTYTDEDTVIINDVDRSNATKLGYYLKIWADPYPLLVEVKGSEIYIDPSYIFVTSNYRLHTLYDDEELRRALHQRYMEITVLDWRETPEGMIEIQVVDEFIQGNLIGTRWLNQHTILDFPN